MFKSIVPTARVEKNQCFNQCCIWQRWKQTNDSINVAEGKGGNKTMVQSMVHEAKVEKKTIVNKWSFPSSFRNQWTKKNQCKFEPLWGVELLLNDVGGEQIVWGFKNKIK